MNLMNEIIKNFGLRYSKVLDIEVDSKKSEEIFKWFLASLLFGKRISEKIAINTYKQFEKDKLLNPEDILKAGWDNLVKSLDAGGYVRYDFSTADRLLEIMKNLKNDYKGDLNLLHKKASNSIDLEKRIKSLGKGIGDVTTNIFLRELRGIWEKSNPESCELVLLSARNLRIMKGKNPLKELKNFWQKNKINGKDFRNFETALLRLGKDYCRKKKCEICHFKKYCENSSAFLYISMLLNIT